MAPTRLHLAVLVQTVACFGLGAVGQLDVPGLDHKVYARLGDVNIGFLVHVYRYSSTDFCSTSVRPTGAQRTEIPSFITDRINGDPSLLPNITMGFVVFDDCQKDLTALARSIYFVPSECDGCPAADRHFQVAGVVGPIYSRQSVMVSSFLGLFDVPSLSPWSTSDELSDKSRFPYFMRLVPPDSLQAVAIVDLVAYFGWTYVSLLYSEGSYGENAAKHIERLAGRRGICLAVAKRLSSEYGEEDIEKIVGGILANNDAPVVILFLESVDLMKVFGYVLAKNLTSRFLWISGDNLPSVDDTGMESVAVGSLYIDHSAGSVPGYVEYMRSLSWKNSTNPWLPLIQEYNHDCTWNPSGVNETKPPCQQFDTLRETVNVTWNEPSKYCDGFMVYAKALHSLISDNCPQLFQKDGPRNFSECVTGSRLLAYMKNVSFDGYTGHISFDSKGDVQGKYIIRQVRSDPDMGVYKYTVGEWVQTTNTLFLNLTKLDWGGTRNLARMNIESVCSHPCKVGQYYQRKEVPCCWECITCRNNEITVDNMTDCQPCPDFMWPDEETRTVCEPITPHYMKSTDAIGLSFLSLEILGVLLSAAVIVVYIVKHNNRLIKATSKELSILILVGCMLACLVAMFFVSYPDKVSCLVRQSGFHLVVCILYSPLLTKTSRVYRIFSAGKKGISRPKFISSKAQVIITTTLILTEVILLVSLEALYPLTPTRVMPFPYAPYVEITCSLHLESFIPPLSFNLSLIFVCAVFGFLTRSLPENFNDSRYIFVSISTTLFMWSVFLPTYFTTLRSDHRAALMSVCLLLNSFITLLCQFFPKVYAVFYVSEENMAVSSVTGTTGSRIQPSHTTQ